MHRLVRIPHGRGSLEWRPSEPYQVTVLERTEPLPLSDPDRAVRSAIEAPVGTPPLDELCRGARSATIVITDATRPCPDRELVAPVLDTLIRHGIPEDAITILVAIGMHRPSTGAEKLEKLGPEIVSRFRVVDSAPLDPALQSDLGSAPDGTAVRIDRRAVESDLLIATGIVEPHQYAGYSGGWKTLGIGTASDGTIGQLHGIRFLEHPRVRLATTQDNPFLETLRWIGMKAGLRFVINVALDSAGRISQVRAGHPEAVHADLSAWVGERAVVPLDAPWPIVIGGAGHPKDANLYQATRIPTYLCFGPAPAVKEGGVILVSAACPEGAGQGPGERLFFERLSSGESPAAIVERARKEGYPAGGQRAVMVAWALSHCRIGVVGSACPDVVKACGLEPFEDFDRAVAWASSVTGERDVLVVPKALTTLPQVGLDNRRGRVENTAPPDE